ncbi:hypothetical protein QQG91_14325 [Marivivens sp. LCG002]|uniref:COG4223 family protein n=1 Tax=Marivivens sp. LCG002 TaxID=3051171 RepID=UPI002555837B|nr:hypothetical protein [Marivivens sp. LCG002]WIV50822.1 hypothetical protein QQG91_14325 [Marivivens sp. LCG002]
MAKPTSSTSKPRSSSRKKGQSDEVVSETIKDMTIETPSADLIEAEAAPVEDASPEPIDEEPEVETAQTDETAPQDEPAAQTQAATTAEKPNSSIVPMVFGGIIAGAIGFGAAVFYPNFLGSEQEATPVVAVEEFQSLVARVDALPTAVSESEIAKIVSDNMADLGEQVAGLERRIEEVSSRLDQALNTPTDTGALSPAALAEYQKEIVDLRAELNTQRTSLAQMVDQASNQLEAAQAQSLQFEQSAAETARAVTLRLALAKVQAVIETGAPYQAIIPEFSDALGDAVPSVLVQNAADGIATQASLVTEFDLAADKALAVARAEGVDGEERTAFGAFLRSQFDVRSVTPQEGTSVDAILSRAQAALNEARLKDALAEVRSLPEVARAELVDWISRAEARSAVIAAVEELSFSLNDK